MPDDQKKSDWVKLPAELETSSHRKASDEFAFTIVAQKKYYDPYITEMLAKLSTSGVFFYVPCDKDQVDILLGKEPDTPRVGDAPNEVLGCPPIPLRDLADLLERDDRTVQLLEGKCVIRISRGLYDRDKTIAALWKAYKEAETGKNDVYNDERTAAMKLKRQERELEYLERAGKLVNAEATEILISKAKAAEKQQLLFMPKQLAPRLDGDPAVNEAVLEEWAHEFLKGQTEINIRLSTAAAPEPDQDKMPELSKKKKRRKKKNDR